MPAIIREGPSTRQSPPRQIGFFPAVSLAIFPKLDRLGVESVHRSQEVAPMLTIAGPPARYGDRLSRRSCLRLGALARGGVCCRPDDNPTAPAHATPSNQLRPLHP